MNVDDRPYAAPGVDSIDLGTETLVYDGIDLHLLTDSAAGIWRRVDGRVSAAQIATGSADGVAGAAEEVHRDVMAFLDQLTEQGMLVTIEVSAGYRRAGHVGYVLDASHALLVDLRDGRRQALNPTGSMVWELICQHGDPATVLRLIRAGYPDAPSTLESEVSALLDQLVTAGLLLPPEVPGTNC